MAAEVGSAVSLQAHDLSLLVAALAGADRRANLLEVIGGIAVSKMKVVLFSASTCDPERMELERVHSSRPDAYPVGARKSKAETLWGQQVVRRQHVFVGEGPLEMAAAFDDQERMERFGIRSIINVPMMIAGRCVGVLNFGRGIERVLPEEILLAQILGLIATMAFLPVEK